MGDRPQETISEMVKNWVTVLAFILAGIWTYFTFTHERIVSPRNAPVNVTTELEVRETGNVVRDENGRLIAVEVRMTAKNPGERIVWLLPSYVLAQGVDITSGDQPAWAEAVSANLEARVDPRQGRYYRTEPFQLIAASTAFTDEFLQPGETVSRSTLVYVPADQFDAVRVKVVIPSVHQYNVLAVDYTATAEGAFTTAVFELGPNNARTLIEDGDYLYRRHGLQWSTSERQLALPRTAPPRPQAQAASQLSD